MSRPYLAAQASITGSLKLMGGFVRIGGFAVLALLSGPALADPVAVAVAPFVWAPSIEGQLSEGPATIPLDASVGDLAGGVKAGGMVHVEADTENVHASVQAIYVDFHDRSFAPVFDADVRSSLLTIEALAGPRLQLGKAEFVPMAGMRHTRIKGKFDAPGLGELKAGRSWQEGLVGLETRLPVSERLALRARGTVAIAGPARQKSADLILAASYEMSQSVSFVAGYRWANEEIASGQSETFGMDLDADGPVLGLSFRL